MLTKAPSLCVLVATLVVTSLADAKEAAPKAKPARFVKDGVAVEFSLRPPGGAATVLEGDQAEARFRVTDAATGRPLRGLEPGAWVDLAGPKKSADSCRETVGLYLKGLVGMRPLVDLNSYFLLVLNEDATISVIDPLVGIAGRTSLYATVMLRRPGADWASSRDGRRLFVAMPRAGQVAVVDTETFTVAGHVDAGREPVRLAVQGDGRYLWVADGTRDTDGLLTVVDTATLKVVARVPVGRGHHELAFSADDRHAFVTNREDGTVTVVEVGTWRRVKELRTGPTPISVATSPLSRFVYVADGRAGTVSVIDPARLDVVARVDAKPGLGPMRFSQDGRWGFVVNAAEGRVFILDAARNQLVHEVALPGQPYQVTFTRAFAYLRLLDSERVAMVNLALLADGKRPPVQTFGAGTRAPKLAGELSLADSVSPAATEAAVFAVNPADSTTYYYMEGMNEAMGSFGNYGHAARAVRVVDRSLREVEPGVYAARFRAPAHGTLQLAFLLDAPPLLHCFDADVVANPALKKELAPLEVEYLDTPARTGAEEPVRFRIRLRNPADHALRRGLQDVTIVSFAPPGRDRLVTPAREVEGGVYEALLRLPRAGSWYAYVAVPSLAVAPGALPYRTIAVHPPRPR